MFSPDDWSDYEASWRHGLPSELSNEALRRVRQRLSRDLQQVLQNEIETRRFLAEEVYGVPESLLDDLIRIRMADL